MARASLSKAVVNAQQAGATDYFVWDKKLSGFGLKVTPAGGKVYVYQYRVAVPGMADKTTPARYTIGKHGELTPDQARKRAIDLAALVAAGTDPRELEADRRKAKEEAKRAAAEKTRMEAELGFSRMADLWLEEYALERRTSTVADAKLVMKNHLKPKLGDTPLPRIGRDELKRVFDAIPAERRATRRNVFAYASSFFGWAVERGDLKTNPMADLAKPPVVKSRDRVLEDGELVELWNAAATLLDPWGPFYRLAVLTGQRREEVAALRWAELDRASATWTIPADRAKNGVAHIVPLSDPVLAELDRLAGMAEEDPSKRKWPSVGYVLTTTGRAPISGFSKAKKALDAKLLQLRQQAVGDGEEVVAMPAWRVHDLRRTLATGLQRLGIRFEVTEAALNHVSGAKGGVAGIYQRHHWTDEKRDALSAWGRRVLALVNPTEAENLVDFDSARAGL